MLKIDVEADKLLQLQTSDSPDYKKYLAIKAYTYLKRGYEKDNPIAKFEPDFLEKALELLEPIKQQKEGIRLFIEVLENIGLYYIDVKQYHEALKYLKKAVQGFELFKTKFADINKAAMDEWKLFECNSIISFCIASPFSENHHRLLALLYKCYDALNDVNMKLKYEIPSIQGRFFTSRNDIDSIVTIKCL